MGLTHELVRKEESRAPRRPTRTEPTLLEAPTCFVYTLKFGKYCSNLPRVLFSWPGVLPDCHRAPCQMPAARFPWTILHPCTGVCLQYATEGATGFPNSPYSSSLSHTFPVHLHILIPCYPFLIAPPKFTPPTAWTSQ